jgi:hypothetical protein
MATKNDIVTLVKKYLQTNDLTTFSHSFAEVFYDIDQTSDAEAIELANEIEGLLAAMTGGVANSAELPSALKALINLPAVTLILEETPVSKEQAIESFFTAATTPVGGTVYLVSFGIAPSAGFSLKADPLGIPQTNIGPPQSQQTQVAQ